MAGKSLSQGLIQVYTGDGKGKTTAALGQALRACGHELKVLIIHFMKGTGYAGELFAAPMLRGLLTLEEFGRGCRYASMIKNGYIGCKGCGECFVKKGQGTKDDREMMEFALARSKEALKCLEYDMIVLDEIFNALYFELIRLTEIEELLALKRKNCELILTGRNFPQELINHVDLISEVSMIKHPFQQGIAARWGIEY